MALPFTVPFIDPTGPVKAAAGAGGKAGDALVPDKVEKVPLSALLQEAGFGGKNSSLNRTFRGITIAESGADPTNDNGDYIGLLQVGVVHAGTCGIPKTDPVTWLHNPRNNLKAGHCVYLKQGFPAWEAYTNRSYQKYVGQDPLITVTDKRSIHSEVVDAVSSPLGAIGDVISALFDPSTYARIGKGLLGGILLILGTGALVFIVGNRVSKATPVRAAAKTLKGK